MHLLFFDDFLKFSKYLRNSTNPFVAQVRISAHFVKQRKNSTMSNGYKHCYMEVHDMLKSKSESSRAS